MKGLNERLEGLDSVTSFVCECADEACVATVEMTTADYEKLRSDPLHFVVVPGHLIVGAERAVYANDRYTIVEKLGAAAAEVGRINRIAARAERSH